MIKRRINLHVPV